MLSYVGYAAKGLGRLLVQNTKDTYSAEHVNPMWMVDICFGEINETQFLQTFSNMFSWGCWQWRARNQGVKFYTMRFPGKAKLVEPSKYGKFTLLGTDAVIKVSNWSPMYQAKGKLHIVWVKCGKVHDCLRHFFGMCELASALGPVLEVDMDTIAHEFVRVKIGVRDTLKISHFTEITSKEFLIFEITFELEQVVEQGWYNRNKRIHHVLCEKSVGEAENQAVGPRQRVPEAAGDKENITLGSISLAQYEDRNRCVPVNNDIGLSGSDPINNYVASCSVNADNEMNRTLKQLQEAEEENARQAARMALEEKRWKEMDIEKKRLEMEI